MTSLDSLDARAAAQARAIDARRREAHALIAAKVADARAHAGRALSEATRNAPDGRATIAKARRSRSYAAAVNRLAELSDRLEKFTREWRETAYRESFAWWLDHVPDEWLRSDAVPRQSDLSYIRGMALHGMPLVTELANATNGAGQRLLATLGQVASRAVGRDDAADLLDAWEARTVSAINATADHLISDSAVMADRKAGRDVCRPEVLHPDPTLPKG